MYTAVYHHVYCCLSPCILLFIAMYFAVQHRAHCCLSLFISVCLSFLCVHLIIDKDQWLAAETVVAVVAILVANADVVA